MIEGMRILRLALVLVVCGMCSLAVAQDTPPPAQDTPPPTAPKESPSGKRRPAGSSIRRTAGARNGKPRRIKMQKMKGVPKFKKPKRF